MDSPAQSARAGAGTVLNAAVVVAALGYFVDIYDLILFNIVRIPSLTAIGVSGDALVSEGLSVLNWQMVGMLLGGIVFGIVGDKLGRLHILFGSITLYSIATIANGFVHDLATYKALRFVAGLGLAGELGAGVTLVAEILPARLRGYGTMLVASVGVSGAIVGNVVAKTLDWRVAYWVGGGLGLLLLVLRIKVSESGMFQALRHTAVRRGDFLAVFRGAERFRRYLSSILIGVPIWCSNAILVALAPEFGRTLGVTGPVTAGDAVMFFYGGLVLGDLSSGFLSQVWRSRRKVVLLFVALLAAANVFYFVAGRGASPALFLGACGLLGIAGGYWAIFVTVAAEQFGTNLRATVATTVPNFVRGLVPVCTLSFQWARPHLGLVGAAAAVSALWFGLALVSAFGLRETFGVELDYVEAD
ncbi:major facilitator superfamily MFS_1 [Anaeromyxobacter dehalogenans 2CP-1]|uniref:Major facilitator superfamily MFS_1 n=1 Tax=Anaeromyxobacter dehalogenans (strain ATCC BAA-258 / DSM 21875 / 2CP-1) TaxID=455488 RepID=B8J8Z1_ANAD2|nr:MFS transporter [Anaeromyxobacter dehalogenans]ACL63589.1 major facilitator superfamily MFS_1 [Anaeromyxobacter dehalogenans 2CP-1]